MLGCMADARALLELGFAEAAEQLLASTPDMTKLLEALPPDELTQYGRDGARHALAPLAWRAVAGAALPTEQVRKLLNVSRQALHKRVEGGTLLGLPGGRTTLFPSWQFSADGTRPVVGKILAEFRQRLVEEFDPRLVAAWATSPQPELEGSTPAGWLDAEGDPEPVVRAARRAADALRR